MDHFFSFSVSRKWIKITPSISAFYVFHWRENSCSPNFIFIKKNNLDLSQIPFSNNNLPTYPAVHFKWLKIYNTLVYWYLYISVPLYVCIWTHIYTSSFEDLCYSREISFALGLSISEKLFHLLEVPGKLFPCPQILTTGYIKPFITGHNRPNQIS